MSEPVATTYLQSRTPTVPLFKSSFFPPSPRTSSLDLLSTFKLAQIYHIEEGKNLILTLLTFEWFLPFYLASASASLLCPLLIFSSLGLSIWKVPGKGISRDGRGTWPTPPWSMFWFFFSLLMYSKRFLKNYATLTHFYVDIQKSFIISFRCKRSNPVYVILDILK